MTLELIAPAKLNLALEVISRRADGYHEVASLMQTIDLADRVRLTEAEDIELSIAGDMVLNVPSEGPRNLAYAAAVAMREVSGRSDLGVRIQLEKNIPAGAGLGGGSSDAAAVLRGLNQLWGLNHNVMLLESLAQRLGSDVTFFLHGGTALVSGRGERVEELPDAGVTDFTLFVSPVEIEDKTRVMYSMITPADFTDGRRAQVAAESVRRGLALAETDYVNAFDRHVSQAVPPMGRAMQYCRDAGLAVIASGSGPGFFSPVAPNDIRRLVLTHLEREYDVAAIACRSLTRAEAMAVREV
ncbi:MAG TPA: 4-(cytidine 5'-diphospho)-2-C-methyl-D-erythritol kinase [Dehalococcoidia bacterium]|nr:4-(cytidine 5'-diphospho)-2-C-methyl-D-erythritol kinase [Dehalococcoidia bacterium]